jgi:hypothetical protein
MLVTIGNNSPIEISPEHLGTYLNSLQLADGTIVKLQSEIPLDIQVTLNLVDLDLVSRNSVTSRKRN